MQAKSLRRQGDTGALCPATKGTNEPMVPTANHQPPDATTAAYAHKQQQWRRNSSSNAANRLAVYTHPTCASTNASHPAASRAASGELCAGQWWRRCQRQRRSTRRHNVPRLAPDSLGRPRHAMCVRPPLPRSSRSARIPHRGRVIEEDDGRRWKMTRGGNGGGREDPLPVPFPFLGLGSAHLQSGKGTGWSA